MIDVSDYKRVITEGSSKGNQLKFYNNGFWYKIDNMNCSEGLAEHFVSEFCKCLYGFNFVEYFEETLKYNDDIYKGCYSYNMYGNCNISFISLRRLFRQNKIPLNIFIKEQDIALNIRNVVNKVGELTNLNIFGYLVWLLFLDALIINEDRHYMNLGVCTDEHNYFLASCFDNGSSLFCTNWTYRKTKSFEENIKSALSVARPFSKFFDAQIRALVSLGGMPLNIDYNKLNWFLTNFNSDLYETEKVELCKQILRYKLGYYNNIGVYRYV